MRLSTRLFRSHDWLGHILARPLADNPGTTFAHSNASSHLLSAIVADTTGQSTLAYQQAAVAWPRDPQGYHFGFGETKLPARDLATFGYLYLNGGRWETTQVVPADHVRASTQPHTDVPWLRSSAGTSGNRMAQR